MTGGSDGEGGSPRIFISYSHAARGAKDHVRELSARLRADGFDSLIDQYVPRNEDDWIQWMEEQLEDASYVLMVCSESYDQRWGGEASEREGFGVAYEAAVIKGMFRSTAERAKFVPVAFDTADREFVVPPLRARRCYLLPDEYDELLIHLQGLPETRMPAIGESREGGESGPERVEPPAPGSRRRRIAVACIITAALCAAAIGGWRLQAARRSHTAVAFRVVTPPHLEPGDPPLQGQLRVSLTHGRGSREETVSSPVDTTTRIARFEDLKAFAYPDTMVLRISCGDHQLDSFLVDVQQPQHELSVNTFCGFGPFDAGFRLVAQDLDGEVDWERTRVTLGMDDEVPRTDYPDSLGSVVFQGIPDALRGTRHDLSVTCGGEAEFVTSGLLVDTRLSTSEDSWPRVDAGAAAKACQVQTSGNGGGGSRVEPPPDDDDTSPPPDDDDASEPPPRTVTLTLLRKLQDGSTAGRCGGGVHVGIRVGDEDRGQLPTDASGVLVVPVQAGATEIQVDPPGFSVQTREVPAEGSAAFSVFAICEDE